MGSFECLCKEDFCGQTCKLINPCLEVSSSSVLFLFHFFFFFEHRRGILSNITVCIFCMCIIFPSSILTPIKQYFQFNCSNGGVCEHLCDEYFPDQYNQTKGVCRCPTGWGGEFCTETVCDLLPALFF